MPKLSFNKINFIHGDFLPFFLKAGGISNRKPHRIIVAIKSLDLFYSLIHLTEPPLDFGISPVAELPDSEFSIRANEPILVLLK